MPDSELERVFVTFLANDKDLEKTYQKVVRRAKEVSAEVSKAFDQSVSKAFTDSGQKVERSARRQAAAVDEVEAAFKALRNESQGLRNAVEAGDKTNKEAIKRFKELQEAALHQARGFGESTDEYRKFTQVAAQASRSVATLEGRATKLGFSANAAVGITSALNQQMSQMGRAGDVAGTAIGIVSAEMRGLMQLKPQELLRGIASSLSVLTIASTALAAAAIAGVTAALFKMGTVAAETADKIDKGSQAAGLSAEAYQELRYAFDQNGVAAAQFDVAVQSLNRRLGLAAAGNATYAAEYERLGVAIKDAHGNIRSTEDVLTDAIAAISRLPSAAEQAASASVLFGDDVGKKLVPVLADGVDGINALRESARELGLVISGDAIMNLVEFKDAVATIQGQFEAARVEIVAAFIPVFTRVLIPFLQNTVVPAIQRVAERVSDLSQKFLDTGPAGAEFRAQMLANIQPMLSFADVVIGVGQGFMSFVQLVLGGAAGIGAALGELSVQVQRFATGMANITEGLAWWQQGNLLGAIEIFKRAKDLGGEVFDPSNITSAFDRAAGEYLDRSLSLAQEAQERLARGLSGDYSAAFNRLTAGIQSAISTGASSFAPALTDAVNDAVTGGALSGVEELPEGSLAALQEEVRAAQRAFNMAVTEEDRAAAKERERIAQDTIKAILAAYQDPDLLADAKAWTGRLVAEMRQGIKDTSTVIDLITAGIENVEAEASQAFDEFGWDSQQYRDAITKLEFLEAFLSRIGTPRTIDLTIVVPEANVIPTELVPPDVVANVLDRPLANAAFLIHKFSSDASDDFQVARESWDDFASGVALGAHQVDAALRVPAAAARSFVDTWEAMKASGADAAELANALTAFPAFAPFMMTGPGGTPAGDVAAQTPLLKAALAEQEAAWAAVQASMTEEQLIETGKRHQAATAEVERLRELYSAATLPAPTMTTGDSITAVLANMSHEFRVAEAAALAFGDSSGLAAEKQRILESAIKAILDLNPAADVQALVTEWERLNVESDETAAGMSGLASVAENLQAAMARLQELTAEAPSEWDQLRAAFEAAGAQGLITSDVLEELLALLDELEAKAAGGSTALKDWASGFNIASDISSGLTSALEGIRDGDVSSVLSGLTDIGVGIGTALGGPMVGALVGAIGSFIETLPALFQTISDLFTGDSPARRELAASLTSTVENAMKAGIEAGLRGADDWRESFRTDLRESIVGALVDAFIEASVTQAIIAPFIDEFTKILHRQGQDAALAFLSGNLNAIISEAEGAAAGIIRIFDRYYEDLDRTAAPRLDASTFSLPDATVSILAAPQWALELGVAAERIGAAGERMIEAAELMHSTFQSGINVNTQSTRGVDAQRAAL